MRHFNLFASAQTLCSVISGLVLYVLRYERRTASLYSTRMSCLPFLGVQGISGGRETYHIDRYKVREMLSFIKEHFQLLCTCYVRPAEESSFEAEGMRASSSRESLEWKRTRMT